MVSTEYSEAISEVLDILQNSDDSIVKRIPRKLIEFWEKNKSSTYIPNLNHWIYIENFRVIMSNQLIQGQCVTKIIF